MWKLDVKIIYTVLFRIVLKDLICRPSAKCNVETDKGTHNTNSYPSVYNRTLPWNICKVHMRTSWNLLSKKGTFSMAALVCWRIFMDFLTPQQILTPKGLHKSWQNKSPKGHQLTTMGIHVGIWILHLALLQKYGRNSMIALHFPRFRVKLEGKRWWWCWW